MMIYKYGLVLTGGQIASAEQVDCLISTAVLALKSFISFSIGCVW